MSSELDYHTQKTHTLRHDPNNEGAIIMKAPTQEHQKKFNHKLVFSFIIW